MPRKPERANDRLPQTAPRRSGGESGELSASELAAVSGGAEATDTTVMLKKLPGKKKPPTLT
jgi:hypothetical protein